MGGFPFEAHSEFLHDVNRSAIFRLRDGDNPFERRALEAVFHGLARCFRR